MDSILSISERRLGGRHIYPLLVKTHLGLSPRMDLHAPFAFEIRVSGLQISVSGILSRSMDMNSMMEPTWGPKILFLSIVYAWRKERQRQRKGERGETYCLLAYGSRAGVFMVCYLLCTENMGLRGRDVPDNERFRARRLYTSQKGHGTEQRLQRTNSAGCLLVGTRR
jgi:hypothetical protein